MTITLVPLPDGLDGDEADRLGTIINAINGYAGQGIRFNLTSYNHASRYGLQVRNGGGLHFAAYDSGAVLASDDPIFEITDSAVTATIPVVAASTMLVGGELEVLGEAIVHGTIAGDAGLDLIGGAEISGTVILHGQWQSTITAGTAPFTVQSSTKVVGLNADQLDGFDYTAFALASSLGNYVLKTGDTMTGLLTMEPSVATDGIVKLKASSTSGSFLMGVSNVAAPVMLFKDHLGVEVFELGNSFSSVYLARVLGGFKVTGAADFDSDMTLGNASGDAIAIRGTATFDRGISVAAVAGSSIFAAPVTIQGLTTVSTGGVDVTGASTFHNAVTVSAGGVTISAGGATITGTVAVTGAFSASSSSSFGAGLSIAGGLAVTTGAVTFPNTTFGAFGATAVSKQTVTGSRGGNAALASLLTGLANEGWITDSSTA